LLGDDHVQAPIHCPLRSVEHVSRQIVSSLEGGGAVNTANIRYRTGVALVGIAALLGFATSAPTAEAGPACIRVGGSCFTTLDSALAAAVDGDTVQVPAGTFAGGATITKSIALSGAGQRETTLRGGGPVLTVGAFGDPNPPTVTIRGLTITGGRTTTSALSQVLFGQDGPWAAGGGLAVPPSSFDFDTGELGLGATVRLVDTTVEGNGAAPTATVDSGLPCPGGHDCPFALAAGGGIDTSGNLTLVHSVVRDNHAGAASGITDLASDNEGGGIRSWAGTLTIKHSRIDDNSATGVAPNARFAEGGAVFHGGGFFPSGGSSRCATAESPANVAGLASGLPDEVDGVTIEQTAIGGGLQLTSEVPAIRIDHSTFSDNSVRATNTVGSATAFAGGVLTNLPTDTRIAHSTWRGNHVSARTMGDSTGLAHADTAGLQLHGTLEHSRVREGTVSAVSAHGAAEAFAGGVWVLRGRGVRGVEVRDNALSATAASGVATVLGAGLLVDEAPEEPGQGGRQMSDSRIRDNAGAATGRTTVLRGGGIYDALTSDNGPFGGPLALARVRVEKNRLSPAATASGAGLFIQRQPLTLRDTRIRDNTPDQCVGCESALHTQIGPHALGSRIAGSHAASHRYADLRGGRIDPPDARP